MQEEEDDAMPDIQPSKITEEANAPHLPRIAEGKPLPTFSDDLRSYLTDEYNRATSPEAPIVSEGTRVEEERVDLLTQFHKAADSCSMGRSGT